MVVFQRRENIENRELLVARCVVSSLAASAALTSRSLASFSCPDDDVDEDEDEVKDGEVADDAADKQRSGNCSWTHFARRP